MHTQPGLFTYTTLIQIIICFVLGGGLIALQSVAGEWVRENYRGLIMGFPTTMVIGLATVGIITSPAEAAAGAIFVPGALVGSLLFVCMYVCAAQVCARTTQRKSLQICTAAVVALLIAIPFIASIGIIAKYTVWLNLSIFFIGLFAFQILFLKLAKNLGKPKPFQPLTPKELLFRFLFSGTLTAAVIVITKILGPLWGVLLGSSFPVSLSSQLMIWHRRYPPSYLFASIKILPLGFLSIFTYVVCIHFTYVSLGIFVGTLASITCSTLMAVSVRQLNNRFIH